MRTLKIASTVALLVVLTTVVGFSQAQQPTQMIGVDLSHPGTLFGRATWAAERAKYAEARSLLQTLIESYPDSELVPNAKLAVANAWYNEGNFQQAEAEYKDFVAFFPSSPDVTQACQKIAAIQANSKM
jgi:outer membrane protein assembly factor BamD